MKESILRTLVPIVYALLLKVGFGAWLGVNDEVMQNLAALVASGLLYVVLRIVEKRFPWLGVLLGYPSQPKYGEVPPNPPEEPHADLTARQH